MSINRRALIAGIGALAVAPALPKLPIDAETSCTFYGVDLGPATNTTYTVMMNAGRVFFVSQGTEVFEFYDPQDYSKWA